MKTKTIVSLAIAGTMAVMLASSAISNWNYMVPLEEKVNVSYAQYQNQLKRQADLLPNLAAIVKGYMTHEQRTNVEYAIARAGDAAKMKPADVANNPELQKALIQAQAAAGRALADVRMVTETTPNLKANEQIKDLMTEVAGTQNRVTIARGNNQKAVMEFNLAARQFPRIILAKVMGLGAKPYFEAGTESQDVPKITL